jgi:hypothetical protein
VVVDFVKDSCSKEYISTLSHIYKSIICGGEKIQVSCLREKSIFNFDQKCECGNEMIHYEFDELDLVCNKCCKKRSLKLGTIWFNSHLNLEQIITLPCHFYYHHNLAEVSKEINLHINSVSSWNKKFRIVCFHHILQKNDRIGGEGRVVEIDECLRMKRKKKEVEIFDNEIRKDEKQIREL